MTKLSPAAQAVWDAYNDVCERVGVFEDYGDALAAALRALVQHEGESVYTYDEDKFSVVRVVREDRILAIAAELDGTNPTNQEDYD